MGRPRTFVVDAVVLRHADFGEADRLLVLYARGRGKLRAIAKGVRRIRSRKAGHLEPLTAVRLFLAEGRDLAIVTQAEALESFPHLRRNLVRLTYALHAAELADKFTYENEDHPGLYRLLVETLRRLEAFPDADLVARYYELRLLDLVGFRPELQQCVRCGAAVRPEPQFFSAREGGVVCPRCGAAGGGLAAVSVEALRYLRHFQRSSFGEAARARPTTAVHREMEGLLHGYLVHVLERRLNAPVFLQHLRRLGETHAPASGDAQRR